ncbi:Probable transmembrane protein of unknown function [Flavobacterium indicum GPTSA100-9 = DSM 17447]|uniref:DUF4258 domain-containing protein n=1 Tax=Flavobacterium indicum (strain DSM 17447 / CIP 109464 / GPTSA100-9) TaxID=1094466 RepID=H8XQS7_FLAIG|nr:DUF4258 domain-containing protein [Flavobacterium indicum]CCG53375.1 Probable transmembrane protein of unknown function [Flavobacterium indicum GPTSA100-9 = DSM 17447]
MSLRYRLAFYLLGLTIGFYFVGEFLGAKAKAKGVEFCYFPNCRVIKDIKSKPFQTSAAVDSIFAKKITSINEINEALDNGDVDFSQSNVSYKKGKKYIIETYLPKNKKVVLTIINYSNKAVLEEIKFN